MDKGRNVIMLCLSFRCDRHEENRLRLEIKCELAIEVSNHHHSDRSRRSVSPVQGNRSTGGFAVHRRVEVYLLIVVRMEMQSSIAKMQMTWLTLREMMVHQRPNGRHKQRHRHEPNR